MDLGVLIPVTAIAIGPIAWVANNWIRAQHGYSLEDKKGRAVGKTDLEADRKIELLSNENGQLKGQVSRLEERIAVLERIATDAPSRLSAEIEKLR